eukprot:scaffold19711_cov78-Skeletonema_dohrnii-CCMP3373.AAC.1
MTLSRTFFGMYATRDDGISSVALFQTMTMLSKIFPCLIGALSTITIFFEGRPHTQPLEAAGFVDSDWAACVKTRRSMTGLWIHLAGGTVACKSRLLPTIALSSTEAEFTGACDAAKVILYVHSILWDLGVPQEAATLLNEDKPTPRTRHMESRFSALSEYWVERDLLSLKRVEVDTLMNMADHFSKQLPPTLIARHVDHILGHVPRTHHNTISLLELSTTLLSTQFESPVPPIPSI